MCRYCTLLTTSPDLGPLANPRLCFRAVSGCVTYKWQVFFHTVAGGDYTFEAVRPFLDQLLMRSGYVVCPGLAEYPSGIRFKTKNVREWGLPFKRIDSQMCLLWHIPKNEKQPHGSQLRDVCMACRRLSHDIRQLLQKASSTPECT